MLPARRLSDFVYCRRRFALEWLHALWADNAETVDGKRVHRRVDRPGGAEAREGFEGRVRSLWLSSERLRLTARLDLLEGDGRAAVPIDFKRGRPTPEGTAWPADAVQLCAQALLLREHGHRCEQGAIWYAGARRRVPVPITEDLVARTLAARDEALALAARADALPAPLRDSPKCPRCSLVGICLPDETWWLKEQRERAAADGQLRPIAPSRDDGAPVHVDLPGARLRKRGEELLVEGPEGERLARIPLGETASVALYGRVHATLPLLQELAGRGVPVALHSFAGFLQAMVLPAGGHNVFARIAQHRAALDPARSLALARGIVAGKIKNQRVLLRRNGVPSGAPVLGELKALAEQARRATHYEELLGIEGAAAAAYFAHFATMLRPPAGAEQAADPASGEGEAERAEAARAAEPEALYPVEQVELDEQLGGAPEQQAPAAEGAEGAAGASDGPAPAASPPAASPLASFDFKGRNRRPPRDPVNALLSFAYACLLRECVSALHRVGLDVGVGFLHRPRHGRPALALDLMEEFRPVVADSAVLRAINTGGVRPRDFLVRPTGTELTRAGRKRFLRFYEQRLGQRIRHPRFAYPMSWRRILEVQARLLAKTLQGELHDYPAFVVR